MTTTPEPRVPDEKRFKDMRELSEQLSKEYGEDVVVLHINYGDDEPGMRIVKDEEGDTNARD
jgi:hypothetical protein